MNGINWTITVKDYLRAHFIQPDGSDKAGTDWTAVLDDGANVRRILVRAYVENGLDISAEEESHMVASFVAERLRAGWTPEMWKGEPGELTVELPR
jgi:hypothetical protein